MSPCPQAMVRVATSLRVRPPSGRSRSRTLGEPLRRLGQAVLWLFVAVLLGRGGSQVGVARQPLAAGAVGRATPAAWPDDEARAFGAAFARVYLTVSSRDPRAPARALARLVSPDLVDSIAPDSGVRARRPSVADVAFARAEMVDRRHALLTF